MGSTKNRQPNNPMSRQLRVGLVGAPYFWSDINFADWAAKGVDLSLVAFAGNTESNRQDLLLTADESKPVGDQLLQSSTEDWIPELAVNSSELSRLDPADLAQQFRNSIGDYSRIVLENLKQHGDSYIRIDKAIATYGTEVIRVARVLEAPHLHIENSALEYLIHSPWRNIRELEFAIARMAYFATDNVLRRPFVIEKVYDFSTSIRGVVNSQPDSELIESFVVDVCRTRSIKLIQELTQIRMTNLEIQIPSVAKAGRKKSRKRAA